MTVKNPLFTYKELAKNNSIRFDPIPMCSAGGGKPRS